MPAGVGWGAGHTVKPKPSRCLKPEEMKNTLRGRRFLLADTFDTERDKPRILVFSSEYGIDLLKQNHDWCIDGKKSFRVITYSPLYRHILRFSKVV